MNMELPWLQREQGSQDPLAELALILLGTSQSLLGPQNSKGQSANAAVGHVPSSGLSVAVCDSESKKPVLLYHQFSVFEVLTLVYLLFSWSVVVCFSSKEGRHSVFLSLYISDTVFRFLSYKSNNLAGYKNLCLPTFNLKTL